MSARLLFVGLLNFSDDYGNLTRSSKKIKMQVLPADAIDVEPLIQELLAQGVLREYEADGAKFLNIKGFLKHQVISRPSKSSIPPCPFEPGSVRTHGVLSEDSATEGNGMEGKGKEETYVVSESLPTAAGGPGLPPCPVDRLVDLYHEVLPELPRCRLMPEARRRALQKRWRWVLSSRKADGTSRATSSDDALGWMRQFFERARDNDFLMGRTARGAGHEGWQCDLDHLLSDKGLKSVVEKTGAAA